MRSAQKSLIYGINAGVMRSAEAILSRASAAWPRSVVGGGLMSF